VVWSWNFTTWATNELDPELLRVRVLLLGLMLGSLLMAIAIPEACGDRAPLFAIAYVAIQVARHGFLTFLAADPGTNERERAGRILTWFLVAGVLWIAGAFADGGARTVLWVLALLVDYGGPLAFFWVPGRPRLSGRSWDVSPGHMAERFQLFVIIALGESIVITGATAAEHELGVEAVAALVVAFLGSGALWWLYFTSIGRIAEHTIEHSEDPGRIARDVYTYLHVLLIGAIVVSAVGDEVVLAHPTEVLGTPELLAVVAGPVLYLLAQLLIRVRLAGSLSGPRSTAIAACLLVGLLGTQVSGLVTAALLTAVLVGLIAWDERKARSRPLPTARYG
jgi:low temperature requirement protein LtrA